jgi:hypothetical protein
MGLETCDLAQALPRERRETLGELGGAVDDLADAVGAASRRRQRPTQLPTSSARSGGSLSRRSRPRRGLPSACVVPAGRTRYALLAKADTVTPRDGLISRRESWSC